MHSVVVTFTAHLLYFDPRTRSLSESVSSSTSRGAYVPRTVAKPLKTDIPPSNSANTVDTGKTGPSTSYETVGSKAGSSPDSTGAVFSPSQDTLGQAVLQHEAAARQRSSPLPKSKAESAKVTDGGGEEVGDFARHVRGTSTPIDISPPATPTNRSHTFDSNYDRSNLEHLSMDSPTSASAGDQSTVTGGEEGGVKRVTLQRRDAVDSTPNSSQEVETPSS